MNIRAYTEHDLNALRSMHAAQGFGYQLPDPNDPLFLVRAVVEDEGRPRMAALLRLTAEAYLLADPRDGNPRQRWQWLLGLHEATRRAAADRGLADVQAFLPPPIARAFSRRLERLGWRRDPWPCFFIRWLHRRARDTAIERAFLRDMATNHLPHIYHALRLLASHHGVPLDEPPPVRFLELNGPGPRSR